MKKCPYCAEEIQDEAVVCRYCGKDLVQTPEEVEPVAPQKPDAITLDEVIFEYLSKGYRVTSQNKDSAQLIKLKHFPVWLLVLSIPAFLYNVFIGLSVMGVATIVMFLQKERRVFLSKGIDGFVESLDQDGNKTSIKTHWQI